jgi:hypothetical protein
VLTHPRQAALTPLLDAAVFKNQDGLRLSLLEIHTPPLKDDEAEYETKKKPVQRRKKAGDADGDGEGEGKATRWESLSREV